MRLIGRGAVVTGAAGGLGRAIVRALAAEGADVALGDTGDGLESVAEEARGRGVRAVALPGDVTRPADMTALVGAALDAFGRVDILVTCAGIDGAGLLTEQDEATWMRVIDVNLGGTYRAIRAALPPMIAQGWGRVVTVSSVYGKTGGHGFVTAYVASKHAVIGLTRALAGEMGAQGHTGITVNAICPGYVRAGMGVRDQPTRGGAVSGAQIFDRYFRRLVPLRRMLEPEEVAQLAVFLALPESGGITGQALNIDGGFFTG